MGRKALWSGVLLALALVLVASAGGRTLATTRITVEVIGKGTVTSSPSGIKCGNGSKTCYLTFSGGVDLTAKGAGDWTFEQWGDTDQAGAAGSCDGVLLTPTCTVSASSDEIVTANFTTTSGTTTSTLSVTTSGDGDVSAPEHDPPGSAIDCGSTCSWTALTESTLTLFQSPASLGTSALLSLTVTGNGTVTGGGLNCGTGGSVCSVYEPLGSTVTLTATVDTGETFTAGWGDDCSGSSPTCTLTMDGDKSVTAEFTDAGGAGTVGPGTATPPSNVFSGWGGACGGSSKWCTVQLNGDEHVSAAWAGSTDTALLTVSVTGKGTVKGGGINCPSACSATQPLNSSVTLTASPGSGYTFTGWSGGCTGSGTTCTFTVDADTDVTATFAPANTLSVTVNGNGAVSGGSGAINCGLGATICAANFAANSTVSLVATAATGATFAGWTGACGGTATTCTVSMNAAKGVTANFLGGGGGGAATARLDVVVTGNGTVSGGAINCGLGGSACSANVTLNSSVTLTATPASGATFGGWGGACATSATNPTCSVSMTAAKSVTATFTGGTSSFQLSVTVTGSGTVTGGGVNCGNGSSTCSANVAANTTVTLTAKPASGATFSGWGGSCSGSSTTCSVKMSSAKSVTATFATAVAPGTLTIAVKGPGVVSTSAGKCDAAGATKTCTQKFKTGAKVVLTATAKPAATFTGWGDDCKGTAPTCTLTLTKGKSVTATFSSSAPPPTTGVVLKSLGPPIVRQTGKTFRVTLRFSTTRGGIAKVSGLRAGRVVTSLSLRVAAGAARIGPFPVARSGLYTFEVRLGGKALRWQACLGRCGAAARAEAGPFVLVRQQPVVTRTGDVWSVTLRYRASQISDSHLRVFRNNKLLADHHFLGQARQIVIGPFLLGPGSYELRLVAVDPWGRTRSLTWIVALGR